MVSPLLLSLILLSAEPLKETQVSFTQEPGATLTHLAIGASITAAGMDLATSMHCLGARTCREVNPLLRPLEGQPLAFGAVKGASSALVAWLLLRYHREHPRLVRVVALALTASSTYIAVRNTRLVRRVR